MAGYALPQFFRLLFHFCMKERIKSSPEESISAKIHLEAYPDRYCIQHKNVFFVEDLHKKDLNNQIEANAFSYAVLHRVREAISKTPHSIPLTLTLSSQKLNQMLEATLTITLKNPNYTPPVGPTEWVKLN